MAYMIKLVGLTAEFYHKHLHKRDLIVYRNHVFFFLIHIANMATMKRRNIPQGIEKQPSFSLLDDNEKDKSFKYYQPPPSPVTYSSNKVLEQDYLFSILTYFKLIRTLLFCKRISIPL